MKPGQSRLCTAFIGTTRIAHGEALEVALQLRKRREPGDRVRQSREAAHKFMTAIAGDLPGFEESLRALYAGKRAVFEALTGPGPDDVRDHARRLAAGSFSANTAKGGA